MECQFESYLEAKRGGRGRLREVRHRAAFHDAQILKSPIVEFPSQTTDDRIAIITALLSLYVCLYVGLLVLLAVSKVLEIPASLRLDGTRAVSLIDYPYPSN
jgi:hypothetical protein